MNTFGVILNTTIFAMYLLDLFINMVSSQIVYQ